MNGLTAAVVIFFLLMCVKRLLLSLTLLLRYDTRTHAHTSTHTDEHMNTHVDIHARRPDITYNARYTFATFFASLFSRRFISIDVPFLFCFFCFLFFKLLLL